MVNEVSCSAIPTLTVFSIVVETSHTPNLVTTISSDQITSFSVSVETVSKTVSGSTSVGQTTQTFPIVQTITIPIVVTSSLPVVETRSLAYATLFSSSCYPTSTSLSSVIISSLITSNSVSTQTTSSSSSLFVQPTSTPSFPASSKSSAQSTTSNINIAAANERDIVGGSSSNVHQSTSYRTVYLTSTVTNNGVASTQQYSSQTADAVGSANNTAAIAGGVIGGIVAVALAAITILLLLRRKRKRSSQVFSAKDIFQPGHHSEKDSSSVIDAPHSGDDPIALNSDLLDEAALWHVESAAGAANRYHGGVGASTDREGYVEDDRASRRLSGYLPRVDEDSLPDSSENHYALETAMYSAPAPLVAPTSPRSYHSSRSPQSPSSPRSLHSPYSFHSQQSLQTPQSYFPQFPPLYDRRQSSQYSLSSTHSQTEYRSDSTVSISHPSWIPTHAGPLSSSSSVKHLMRPSSESSSWLPEPQEKSQQSVSREAEGNSRTNRGTRSGDVIEEETEAPPTYPTKS